MGQNFFITGPGERSEYLEFKAEIEAALVLPEEKKKKKFQKIIKAYDSIIFGRFICINSSKIYDNKPFIPKGVSVFLEQEYINLIPTE